MGSQAKFITEEKFVILRKVAAAKGYIAPSGENRKRFKNGASEKNGSSCVQTVVIW